MVDDTERKATELGLDRVQSAYPTELETALSAAARLAALLPHDLHWTEEPANTFGSIPRRTLPS